MLPFIPITYRKTIEITLKTGVKEYPLDKYQSLNFLKTTRIMVPQSLDQGTVVSPTGKILSGVALNGAYIILKNTNNETVDQDTPLLAYAYDSTFVENSEERGRALKDKPCIDFTQSKVYFPDNTIPDDEAGKSILIIIESEDINPEPSRIPEQKKLYRQLMEITLEAGNQFYPLNVYQRLINKRVRNIMVPCYNQATIDAYSPSGKDLYAGSLQNFYASLPCNDLNQLVDDQTQLSLFGFDATFLADCKDRGYNLPGKPPIDFTNAFIFLASATVATTNAGESLLIIVEYEDC